MLSTQAEITPAITDIQGHRQGGPGRAVGPGRLKGISDTDHLSLSPARVVTRGEAPLLPWLLA